LQGVELVVGRIAIPQRFDKVADRHPAADAGGQPDQERAKARAADLNRLRAVLDRE